MTNDRTVYLPPGFDPYAPQASWDRDIYRSPFPAGGRKKRRRRTFIITLLIVVGIVGAAMGATALLENTFAIRQAMESGR